MVSSNNGLDAEEMFKSVRHFSKDFLEYLYIAAEKDGNFVLPEEAVAAFFRFLRDQPGQPGLSIDLTDSEEDRLGRRLYRHLCDDALAAYRRHTPGFQKRLAGAPRKDALADEAAELKKAGLSYAQIAIRLNGMHGKDTTTQENIRGLLKSRRLKPQKAATPPDKTRS